MSEEKGSKLLAAEYVTPAVSLYVLIELGLAWYEHQFGLSGWLERLAESKTFIIASNILAGGHLVLSFIESWRHLSRAIILLSAVALSVLIVLTLSRLGETEIRIESTYPEGTVFRDPFTQACMVKRNGFVERLEPLGPLPGIEDQPAYDPRC